MVLFRDLGIFSGHNIFSDHGIFNIHCIFSSHHIFLLTLVFVLLMLCLVVMVFLVVIVFFSCNGTFVVIFFPFIVVVGSFIDIQWSSASLFFLNTCPPLASKTVLNEYFSKTKDLGRS